MRETKIDWQKMYELSQKAKGPEDIKKLFENPPMEQTNILELPEDILKKITYYVELETKTFKQTDELLKETIIDYLNINGVQRYSRCLTYMDDDLYDVLVKITDNIKEIDEKKIIDYYFDTEDTSIYNLYSKIIDTKIYLRVPFKNKDDAKILGAKFDFTKKKWYGFLYNKKLLDTFPIFDE